MELGPSGATRPTACQPPALQLVRALAVDDDPQAPALMAPALADARFECAWDVVGTADEGLKRIDQNARDVYLVDYRLPDLTGLELIQTAKEKGIDKPFILMTGYGSGAMEDAALKAGAADYVEKHLLGVALERVMRCRPAVSCGPPPRTSISQTITLPPMAA